MLIKTNDRWKPVEAFINMWLKDDTLYCNNCGLPFHDIKDKSGKWEPCCENPELGTNWSITKRIIEENKELRKTRKNQYASTDKKDFRFKTRIPPKLYHDLTRYFEKEFKQKLFRDKKDATVFARKFPVFRVPDRL